MYYIVAKQQLPSLSHYPHNRLWSHQTSGIMSGAYGHAKPHTETVPTVYNGLRLTAVLEEKRGTYGDDPAVEIR
jgi:hypothetical protein